MLLYSQLNMRCEAFTIIVSWIVDRKTSTPMLFWYVLWSRYLNENVILINVSDLHSGNPLMFHKTHGMKPVRKRYSGAIGVIVADISRSEHNSRNFADSYFGAARKWRILPIISAEFLPKGAIYNKSALELDLLMDWWRIGDKPLPTTMTMNICPVRPNELMMGREGNVPNPVYRLIHIRGTGTSFFILSCK